MSLRLFVCAAGILALSLVASGSRNSGCTEHKDLRGRHSLDCGDPSDDAGDGDDKTEAKAKEDKKLKIDKSGSPTNKDIETVEKAVIKTVGGRVYNWPLALRLCVVFAILAIPVMIVAGCISQTPPQRLSSSVAVKTALHCSFAFSVGWLNCVMLLRYRIFATMMVGNTILMGVAFVCNGGFGTAHEDEYWWAGKRVQKLCPAQFDDASHYLLMILLFLVGAFIQGLLHKKFQWSARAFAPVIATGIIIVEVLEYFSVIRDSKVDVYLLSPIFGMFVSICCNGGIGSVPWAATGHMTGMAFKFAGWCTDFSSTSELQSALINGCVWISFVLGIMMGTIFHSNRTVMLNALYLQCLLILNGMIYGDANDQKANEEKHKSGMRKSKSSPANIGDGAKQGLSPKAKSYSSCQAAPPPATQAAPPPLPSCQAAPALAG